MYEKHITTIKKHLIVKDGQVFATSLDVANTFDKKHLHVLEAVRNLKCSPEFTESNFRFSEYKDPTGRMLPMVEMTRKGFFMLAMGFKGEKAVKFKEVYIEAFDQMEKALLEGNQPVIDNLVGAVADLMTTVGKLADHQQRLSEAVAWGTNKIIDNQPAFPVTSKNSNVADFVRQHCVLDGNMAVRKDVLYDSYREYCKATTSYQETTCNFFKLLYHSGFPVRSAKICRKGERFPVVRGLNIEVN